MSEQITGQAVVVVLGASVAGVVGNLVWAQIERKFIGLGIEQSLDDRKK